MSDGYIDAPMYIDNPPQFFFWELDELLPIAAGAGLGIILRAGDSPMPIVYGVLAGMGLAWIYGRYKMRYLPGALRHILYRSGVGRLNDIYDNKRGLVDRLDN